MFLQALVTRSLVRVYHQGQVCDAIVNILPGFSLVTVNGGRATPLLGRAAQNSAEGFIFGTCKQWVLVVKVQKRWLWQSMVLGGAGEIVTGY